MKRIIFLFIVNIFRLPFLLYELYKYDDPEKYDNVTRYAFPRKLAHLVHRRGRVKLICHGIENIPKENGYIMFPNHQGMFDAVAIVETHDKPIVTVMKKEVKDIFLLRNLIRNLDAEIIDREDIKQSLTVINNMAKRVKGGENFVIFAEGTRSLNGNKIGEFKGGSFKSATKSKCPIVPVALIDSFKVFDTKSLARVTVQIHYLPPITYEEYKDMNTTEIAEYVHDLIQKTIDENTVA